MTSLVSFNVGVELGQLLVLALAIPALALLFTHVVAERMGTIILSALVAHTAWHWMLDRCGVCAQYHVRAAGARRLSVAASVARGLMLLLIVAGAGWAMFELCRRLQRACDRRRRRIPSFARADGD